MAICSVIGKNFSGSPRIHACVHLFVSNFCESENKLKKTQTNVLFWIVYIIVEENCRHFEERFSSFCWADDTWADLRKPLTHLRKWEKNSFFSFKNILGNLEYLYSGDTIIFLQTLASLQWHVKVPLERREAESSLFIRKRSRHHNYDWLSQQNERYEQTGKEMKEKY